MPFRFRRAAFAAVAAALLSAAVGCASGPPLPAPGSVDADKFLFDRGSESLQRKKWLAAREYFRRLVDTYPRSQYRKQAKLGIGDSFLGEGRIDSLILGANEYREFLTFFPLDELADYAQYKLSIALSKQMLGPQRDQTATHDALRELDRFLKTYPDSKYRPEVEKLFRTARDRLSESEFEIGRFHYRARFYLGAIQRLRGVLTDDPGFTRKDAVYFYLGETLMKVQAPAEAVAYYARLAEEFPKSEFAERANKRQAEIKRLSDPARAPAVPKRTGR